MQKPRGKTHIKQISLASALLMAVTAGDASAGGFAVREQSSSFLGTSFAGNAAGGDMSSMYWNSAALGMMDADRKV